MKILMFQVGMMLLTINVGFGQGTISGTITDAHHLPLSNVTVFMWRFYFRMQ